MAKRAFTVAGGDRDGK